MYRNVQFKQAGTTNNLFSTAAENYNFGVKGNGIIECANPTFQIVITDEEGNAKKQYYDKAGRLVIVEDAPTRAVTLYTYDNSGNKTTVTDGLNNVSTFVYDDLNRLQKQRDAIGNETVYAYDSGNKLISTKNAKGIYSYNEYDTLGRLIRKKEPATDGSYAVTRFVYDSAGNKTKEISPKFYDSSKDTPTLVNSMTGITYLYDNMNRKYKTTDADSKLIEWIKYDEIGNIAKVVDGIRYNGNIDTSIGTSCIYNQDKQVIQVKDALGNITDKTYDNVGNLKTIKDAKGNVTSYDYYPDNTLKRVTFPDTGFIEYTYDKIGQKKTEKDQRGNITTYDYNSLGKVTKVTDPYNNTIVNQYDAAGNVTSTKDKLGNYTYFSYNANNKLIQKKTPLEKDTAGIILYTIENYTYDALGNLNTVDITGTKDSASHRITTNTYYDNNLLNTTTDNNGAYKKNYYDKNGNLIKCEVLRDTGKYDVAKYSYDNMNRLTKSIKLIDETDIYNASTLPNIAALRDSEYPGKIQMITGYTYDILGNKTNETAPAGYGYIDTDTVNRNKYTTTYSYDTLNRLEKVIWKYNGNDVFKQFYYDAVGNKTKVRDEKERYTEYTYDSMNRVKTIKDPRSKIFTYNYDLAGNKTSEINSIGNKISYEYDNLNRVIIVKDPYDKIISRKIYDANGNVTKVIDAKGYLSTSDDNARYGTVYSYNLANLLEKIIDPEIAAKANPALYTEKYEYNQYGQKTKTIDALNNKTSYEYDNSGKLIKVTDSLNKNTIYSYDKAGNKTSTKDGRLKETKYVYSDFGKIKSITDADNKASSYQYDINRNLAKLSDRNGNYTLYTYDNRNLMLSRSVSQTGDSVYYTYDELGNRSSMTDSTGGTSYSYNENNWLTNVLKDGVNEVSYTYDDVGNILTVTDKKGNITSYTYDKSNRMSTVTFNGKVTTYNYDDNGNRSSIIYPGGTTESYSYDKVNRILSVTNKKPDQTVTSSYSYIYYDNGLQKSKTDQYGTTNVTTTYLYDGDGRVTQASSPGKLTVYYYDDSGNRLSMTETHVSDQFSGYIDETTGSEIKYRSKSSEYVYSDANKLLRNTEYMKDASGNELLQRITSYFYDNNGNELSENVSYVRASIPNPQISLGVFDYDTSTTAVIDSKINLTNNEYDGFNRLTKVDIMKSGKRTITQYQYNGDDLRVKKTVMTSANSYVPDVTYYYYDRQHVILETDASNNTKVRYVRGLDYIARLDSSNKVSLMLYNGHGDVVQTISETGNEENLYDYDIFGTAAPLAPEQYVCNIRYAGEYYDNETGLYYLRSRYYNPIIGRFTIEDSYLGEDSNPLSLNLYTYTMNNPIRFIDPSGHVTQDLQGDVTYNPYTGKSYDSYGNLVGNTNTIKYDPRQYSEDVVQMQSMLRSKGYEISVDGYFGKQTEEAVRAFQKANNLTVDGIVGQKTWAALLPAPERKSDNSELPDFDELGNKGTGNTDNYIPAYQWDLQNMRDSENIFYKAVYFGKYLWDRVPGFYGELQEQNALKMGMDPEWAELTGDYSSGLFLEGFTSVTIHGIRAYKNFKTGTVIYESDVIAASGMGSTAKRAAEASKYAAQATKNSLSNEVVLGRYNLNEVSYAEVAKSRGATYFELDNWDEVAKTFGNDNMWSINEKFLDQQWSAGKDFLLSHNPWEAATPGSYYEKEILHLIDLGAKDFVQIGDNLWKVVK